MTESEATAITVQVAPTYPITVTEENGVYSATPTDFNYMTSRGASYQEARGLAYHMLFQAIKLRLINGSYFPPPSPAR
jgi:predicted RNase H-like HicB family nuclease